MSNSKLLAITTILSAILIVSIGCGPKQQIGTVSGVVTLEGKPLSEQAKVVISFSNEATGRGNGNFLNPDGSYKVDRLEVGNYKIGITPDIDLVTGPDAPPPMKTAIPEKYSDPHSSGLTFTVQQGANTYDIDLKKK